ncbi:hypothetical protein [Clostridium sp. LIBA-8841]|nr:hypothetical protein [Clostridium sp. LIBA-8841]MDZ5253639.1 hypothetical protein [Clostridium sp. LIBA-8841]
MYEEIDIERINHNMNYYEFTKDVLDRLDWGIVTVQFLLIINIKIRLEGN